MMCRTQLSLCAGNALSHTTTVVVNEFQFMEGTLCVTPFFAWHLVFEVNVSAKCVVIQVDRPSLPWLD